MSKKLHSAMMAFNYGLPLIAFSLALLQGISEQNAVTALKGVALAALFGLNIWGVKK